MWGILFASRCLSSLNSPPRRQHTSPHDEPARRPKGGWGPQPRDHQSSATYQTSTTDNHHQILKEEKDMQPHNPKQASRAHPPQTRSLRRAIPNQSDVLYQNSSSTTTTKRTKLFNTHHRQPMVPRHAIVCTTYWWLPGATDDRRYCLPNLLLLTRWIGYVGDGGFSTLHR